MSNKEIYFLTKVIDPNKHMPEDIKKVFFQLGKLFEMSNDSFINWVVESPHMREILQEDKITNLINNWLIENGFSEKENVIILHWW